MNRKSPYETLLSKVIADGTPRSDRTGTGTVSIFGTQSRYDLTHNRFPLVTTKKVFHKAVFVELCWLMKGLTSTEYLHKHGVTIWDEWADSSGGLGPIYGQQWRSWSGKIDQLRKVIDELKVNPTSRRHIVSAWNPEFIDDMALPPCHTLFQFYSDGVNIDCQLYQRSCDLFLGGPFNIASYAALTFVVGWLTGLQPREFIHTIGDAHIYTNHLTQVQEQLSRSHTGFPRLEIVDRDQDDPRDFEPTDFVLHGYSPHQSIKAQVSV